MNLFKIVWKNLWGRKLRFFFTLTGITLGITSLVILITLGTGLRGQIQKQASDLGANLVITPKGWCAYEQVKVLSGNQLPDAIPPEELEKISDIEGIDVIPYLTVGTALNNEPVPVTGVLMDVTGTVKRWEIKEGLGIDDPQGREVLAGAAIAASFDLKTGQTIKIRGQEFAIKGILEETGTKDDGVLFIPLKAAQEVYETQGRISFAAIAVHDINKVEYMSQIIAEKANVAVVSDKQLLGSVLSVVNSVNTTLKVIAAVAVLTAAFGIANTMLTATYERKKEIGILKAIGASKFKIFQIFLLESALYGFIGALLGLAIGSAASPFLTPLIAQNEFTAFISSMEVVSFLSLQDMLTILAGSLLIAIISGVYPALRAASLTPVEAISYE